MKRLFGHLTPFLVHLRRHWKLAAFTVIVSNTVSAANLGLPLAYKALADAALAAQANLAENAPGLFRLILLVFGLLLVRRTIQATVGYASAVLTSRVTNHLREGLFAKLQRLPLSFFDDNQSGALVSSLSNDIGRVMAFIGDLLGDAIIAPVTLVGGLACVLWIDPVLGGSAMLGVALSSAMVRGRARRMRAISRESQRALAELTTGFLESVSNIRIVRAFYRGEHEQQRFAGLNERWLDLRLRNSRLGISTGYLTDVLSMAVYIGVVWLCVWRIAQRLVEPGELVALLALMQTVRAQLNTVVRVYTEYQNSLGGSERLGEIMATPDREPWPGQAPTPAGGFSGALELCQVSFSYPDGTPVLTGADLAIQQGEKVALVGPSGTGKSTLASLLLGQYDVTGGAILMDGVDIRDIGQERLLGLVSVVPQDVGLFSGTVRENVSYAVLEATDEQVREACRLANAHDFIMELAEGYDTFVGDQGVRLSGGQRQRLAIARALLRNPRFLILDEATSHVDPTTEALVHDALRRLLKDRTTLIIAHHASAIQDADRVVELRHGTFRMIGAPEAAKLRV